MKAMPIIRVMKVSRGSDCIIHKIGVPVWVRLKANKNNQTARVASCETALQFLERNNMQGMIVFGLCADQSEKNSNVNFP